MKQILIDSKIKALSEKYRIFFLVEKQNILNLLEEIKTRFIHPNEVIYINNIINNYDDIIIAKPTEIVTKWLPFFGNVPCNHYDDNRRFKFYEEIIIAMKYKEVRSNFFIKVLQELEINCCVYCHMQSTLITEILYKRQTTLEDGTIKNKGDVRKYKAFLELDHYYSKSEYPFLCTSFFNLYPVCSNCNKSKSKKKIDYFELYIENALSKHYFEFLLTKESKAKYLVSNLKEDIDIKLNHPNVDINKKYNEDFKIELAYKRQKDIVEELFFKQKQYTKIYKKSIEEILNINSLDDYMFKRIILGNYSEENEIHKRPLAKFYQDIAKDLKLFKK